MTKKHWILLVAAIIAIGAVATSYVRAYRVDGWSDAPSFLVGDRVLVLKAAYDVRLPFTDIVVFSHSRPQRGEVIMFCPPGGDFLVFKRVVACSGDTVAMRDNRLEINGVPLTYERVDEKQYDSVAKSNKLGTIIAYEIGNGPSHMVTYTPEAGPHASFEPFFVPEGFYFTVGDNRDHSKDSRTYGPIPFHSILGKVVRVFRSNP